nr:E3 ubiquitin-protein ligase RNF152-like isoform X1 [Oncorhynchus nerka]
MQELLLRLLSDKDLEVNILASPYQIQMEPDMDLTKYNTTVKRRGGETKSMKYLPKLLDCQHTCCSVCLTQMKMSLSELRCPWCRSVTTLPPGVSISQLPDDPDIMAVISVPSPPEYTPVFFKQLLSNTCYLSIDHQERATVSGEHSGRHLQAGQTQEMSPVPVSDEGSPGLGEEHGEREEGCCKSSFTTRAGLVVLLGFVLLLLVYIVLYNMKCIYKRFTMISCA